MLEKQGLVLPGERDAEVGPRCLDLPRAGAVDQAAGRAGLVNGLCLVRGQDV